MEFEGPLRVHKSLPLDCILVHLNSVHTLSPYFLKIHFNVILPSVPKYFNWQFPLWFELK
jgi:hypothetical protein